MFRLIFALQLLLCSGLLQAADLELEASFCRQSLYGEKIAAHEGFNELITELSKKKSDRKVRIRYGSVAEVCALELRDWLVALAVPKNTILMELRGWNDEDIHFDLVRQ